jgi:shikimate 5-dehydrogenase
MLIFQGASSFEIWTGKKAPVNVMITAAKKKINS